MTMPIAARPDSPRWATSYPQGAAYTTLVIVEVGVVAASALSLTESVWVAVEAAGWAMLVSWAFAWMWRSAVMRIPGTRKFATQEHRFSAQYACRSLVGAGLEFMVIEAWDNLSRASLGGYDGEFDEVIRAIGNLVAGAKLRDPVRQDVRDFADHVRALDQKLREDPKPPR